MAAHANSLDDLDKTGYEMINYDHYMRVEIKERLDEIHRLWELLLSKLKEKGKRSKSDWTRSTDSGSCSFPSSKRKVLEAAAALNSCSICCDDVISSF